MVYYDLQPAWMLEDIDVAFQMDGDDKQTLYTFGSTTEHSPHGDLARPKRAPNDFPSAHDRRELCARESEIK